MSFFNFEELKEDLKDYYGTAAFSGFPVAFMDILRIENASEEELIKEAIKNGMDLTKYT